MNKEEKEIPDGIHLDISIEDYHANTSHVSATSLKRAKKSMKEFHWYRTGKMVQEDKPHFGFGNAFELALFDKDGFDKSVAIAETQKWLKKALDEKPDLKVPALCKSYQSDKESFEILNRGKYLIPDVGTDSKETIEHMLESCYQDASIQRLIKNTEYQVSCFWTDPETGLKLKTRPDICQRKKNVIVNVKTAIDGSPNAFSKELAKYDYPLQACIEMIGCVATGVMESVDNYFWLVVEKTAPYNGTIYEFDQQDIAACMDEAHYIFHKVKQAEKQNLYPGYGAYSSNEHGILTAQIPLWYKNVFIS